jgi:hypothetical protein
MAFERLTQRDLHDGCAEHFSSVVDVAVVGSARFADLPTRKAAPADYVRVSNIGATMENCFSPNYSIDPEAGYAQTHLPKHAPVDAWSEGNQWDDRRREGWIPQQHGWFRDPHADDAQLPNARILPKSSNSGTHAPELSVQRPFLFPRSTGESILTYSSASALLDVRTRSETNWLAAPRGLLGSK